MKRSNVGARAADRDGNRSGNSWLFKPVSLGGVPALGETLTVLATGRHLALAVSAWSLMSLFVMV